MNYQDKIDLLNRLLESEFTGLECYRTHASSDFGARNRGGYNERLFLWNMPTR